MTNVHEKHETRVKYCSVIFAQTVAKIENAVLLYMIHIRQTRVNYLFYL